MNPGGAVSGDGEGELQGPRLATGVAHGRRYRVRRSTSPQGRMAATPSPPNSDLPPRRWTRCSGQGVAPAAWRRPIAGGMNADRLPQPTALLRRLGAAGSPI